MRLPLQTLAFLSAVCLLAGCPPADSVDDDPDDTGGGEEEPVPPTSVLFIGNSFTFWNDGLETHVEALRSGTGDRTFETEEETEDNGLSEFELCFEEIMGVDPETEGGPDYDQFSPVIGTHCAGTDHQDIADVERVVFLGDSVTVGNLDGRDEPPEGRRRTSARRATRCSAQSLV